MNVFSQYLVRSASAAAGAVLLLSGAYAADISGAGASFPYPLYAKWAEGYKAKTGIAMNYQSIGSGGGIKQIKNRTVDFGASDMPLKGDELKAAGLIQFPTVVGGVVPVVNVKGIQSGKIRLNGKVLADIYLGKITKWDDAAIARLNSGLDLPDQNIAVIHRSDGSGTTFIFAHYLSKVSPEWKDRVGVDTSLQWPTGFGGKGNEGVAASVGRTEGAIGYVEYAYAKKNGLVYALMENRAGRFVAPEIASFQSAAANADWSNSPAYDLLLTHQPGDKSWPITGATFILMHARAEKPERSRQVLEFFAWAYQDGDRMAEGLDYVPMPGSVVDRIEDTWTQIRGPNGQQVWSDKSM